MTKRLLALVLSLAVLMTVCVPGVTAVDSLPTEPTDSTVETLPPETTEPEEPEEPTEPEVTEPEATEPAVTEPEVTEPVATEPEVTEPEATEPEVTEPVATEPEVTEPEVTEPVATEPEVTEPVATEPVVTEPEATEPVATEPVATEPEATEPVATEPVATDPEPTQPPITEMEPVEPVEPESTSFDQLPPETQQMILNMIYAKEGLNPGISTMALKPAAAVEYIAATWFTVEPTGAVTLPENGIAAGDIAGNPSIPKTANYTFDSAYFNGVKVLRIGQVQADTDKDGKMETYVYYVTNPDNTELVAQVLSNNDRIVLKYRNNPLPITYSVSGASMTTSSAGDLTMQGVPFGGSTPTMVTVLSGDRPQAVFAGEDYTFQVTVPRGYSAIVSVNGTELKPVLGITPEYRLAKGTDEDVSGQHGTILQVDPDAALTPTSTYTVTNVQEAQNVTVALTKNPAPTFSADLVSYTNYFGGTYNNTTQEGKHGDRTDSYINAQPYVEKVNTEPRPWRPPEYVEYEYPYWDRNPDNETAWTGEFDNDHKLTWNLATVYVAKNGIRWKMDALQLNGTDITLPFTVGVTETTTLPSGTVVTVKLEAYNSGRNYYSIAITNCYENIVVTGGNLNSVDWQEFIPYEFIGVDQFQYLNNQGNWVEAKISQPFARNDANTYKTFRFSLLPGYGYPHFALDQSDNQHTPILNPKDLVDKNSDGWYTINFSKDYTDDNNLSEVTFKDSDFPVLILVRAHTLPYRVVYAPGEVENAQSVPEDDNKYYVADSRDDNWQVITPKDEDVLIPLTTPIDPTGQKVFVGWENGGNVYDRNMNLIVTDLQSTWVDAVEGGDEEYGHQQIVFTALWKDVSDVETISYTLEIHRSDLPEGEPTFRAKYTSIAPKGVKLVIDLNAGSLKQWLETNYWFEVDMDKTKLVHENLTNGATIYLYVKEKMVNITYKALGGGTVSLGKETVKMKSGVPAGSTATPVSGHAFHGWFLDEAGLQSVPEEWVDGNNKILPQKATDALWQDVTYYAIFSGDIIRGDLTITKTCTGYMEDGQSFLFTITGPNNLKMTVVIHGTGSVTVKDLPLGEYTVTEDTSWSWRYTVDGEPSKAVTVHQGSNNEVVFHNTRSENKWVNTSAWCDNSWLTGTSTSSKKQDGEEGQP